MTGGSAVLKLQRHDAGRDVARFELVCRVSLVAAKQAPMGAVESGLNREGNARPHVLLATI